MPSLAVARLRAFAFAILTCAGLLAPVGAQQSTAPRTLTAADYARAERFMTYNTTPLVLHSAGRATWVADGSTERFWVPNDDREGRRSADRERGRRREVDVRASRVPRRAGRTGRRRPRRRRTGAPRRALARRQENRVLIAGSITKSGNTISGNIVGFGTVATNPGYESNPGHPGTGTIVVNSCGE